MWIIAYFTKKFYNSLGNVKSVSGIGIFIKQLPLAVAVPHFDYRHSLLLHF
jgi:hypothetical protein